MISKKAHVSDAVIGERTSVWQFASVIRGAVLGEGCTVAANAIVDGARIGDRCLIGHGAGVHPGAYVGDGVFIGPGAVLCNDAWPRAHKRGFDPTQRSVTVESGASIGACAVVLPGVRIGAGAMVAAGVTVTRDVPPGYLCGPGCALSPITDEEARCERRSQRGVRRVAA